MFSDSGGWRNSLVTGGEVLLEGAGGLGGESEGGMMCSRHCRGSKGGE